MVSSRKLEDGVLPEVSIVLDAGYTYTRAYIVKFPSRVLGSDDEVDAALSGDLLSLPIMEDLVVSEAVEPGIGTFTNVANEVDLAVPLLEYFAPIILFLQEELAEYEADWARIPMYFGGTGGMRQIPQDHRLQIINIVVRLFESPFVPFLSDQDQTRTISGQEQAALEWASLNYLQGTLIPSDSDEASSTLGLLRLSETGIEIAFEEPDDDIMASNFKLQIGPRSFWNLYAHTYDFSGVITAFDRLDANLVAELGGAAAAAAAAEVYNPCLPGQSLLNVTSRIEVDTDTGLYVPFTPTTSAFDPDVIPVETFTYANSMTGGDYEACAAYAKDLLVLDANPLWCDFEHNWECALAGAYQPPIPVDSINFVATDGIYDTVNFFGLAPVASLPDFLDKTQEICAMSMDELVDYNDALETPYDEEEMVRFCFTGTFIYAFLVEGMGFPTDYNLTVVPPALGFPGSAANYALGAAIYEVNTRPWKIDTSVADNVTEDLGMYVDEELPPPMQSLMSVDDSDPSTTMSLGGVFLFLIAFAALVVGVQKLYKRNNEVVDDQVGNEMLGLNSTTYGTRSETDASAP